MSNGKRLVVAIGVSLALVALVFFAYVFVMVGFGWVFDTRPVYETVRISFVATCVVALFWCWFIIYKGPNV